MSSANDKSAALGKPVGKTRTLIIFIVSLFLMFGFGHIVPPWATLNKKGVQIVGIFVGSILMASAGGKGLIVPCMIGLFAIVSQGLATSAQILSNTFGSAIIMQSLMVFVIFYGILECGAGDVLAKKMIGAKFTRGKPYLFVIVFMIAMVVGSMLMSTTNTTILGFAILHSIRKQLGYEEDSKWFKCMVFASYFCIAIGCCLLPFKDMQMSVWANAVTAIATFGIEQDFPIYLAVVGSVLVIMIVLWLFSMKFIFRLDMSKLKALDASTLEAVQGAKFTKKQIVMLCCAMAAMLYPCAVPLLPKEQSWVIWLKSFSNIQWYMLIIFIMSLIHVDGERLFSPEVAFSKGVRWPIIAALFIFMYAGTLLSTPEFGVRQWLVDIFTPIFGNVPFPLFIFFASLCTIIMTNLMSNNATAVIMGTLTAPFMMQFVEFSGGAISPYVYGPMMTLSAMMAWATMASGPISPLLIGEDCMMRDGKFLYGVGGAMSIVYVVVVTVVTTLLAYVM